MAIYRRLTRSSVISGISFLILVGATPVMGRHRVGHGRQLSAVPSYSQYYGNPMTPIPSYGPVYPRYYSPSGIITNGAGMQFRLNGDGTASPIGGANNALSNYTYSSPSTSEDRGSRLQDPPREYPSGAETEANNGFPEDEYRNKAFWGENGAPTGYRTDASRAILNDRGQFTQKTISPTGAILDKHGRPTGETISPGGGVLKNGIPTRRSLK